MKHTGLVTEARRRRCMLILHEHNDPITTRTVCRELFGMTGSEPNRTTRAILASLEADGWVIQATVELSGNDVSVWKLTREGRGQAASIARQDR